MRCQKQYTIVNEKTVVYLKTNWTFLIFSMGPHFMFLHANPSSKKCGYDNNNMICTVSF